MDDLPSVPHLYMSPPLIVSVGTQEDAAYAGTADAATMTGAAQATPRARERRETGRVSMVGDAIEEFYINIRTFTLTTAMLAK